ncbi:hypothetical protein [Salinigranum halophilum]|uniref:hypothetical protein n=1 Tax=Salinigranum halophilum TaxID=2565931 RepID=UPI0010A94A4A|nr:hypothetical protein [Salinigranum halophilum]
MRDDGVSRPDVRVVGGLPRPTWRESATISSVPVLLLLVHFLVQPAFDTWMRLKYVRHSVAQTTPVHRLAPEPFTPYAWVWHELTRVAHALIHAPGEYHSHVLGNVALLVVGAWALLVMLTTLGSRQWFVFYYWELVVVGPIVGSFAFDLFGTTPNGYGASTVGFAFLGSVGVLSALALASDLRRLMDRRAEVIRSARLNGNSTAQPLLTIGFLCFVVALVAGDFFVASPATPVHQAGVGFGIVVGVTSLPLIRRL